MRDQGRLAAERGRDAVWIRTEAPRALERNVEDAAALAPASETATG
jgi:hypothetical protein